MDGFNDKDIKKYKRIRTIRNHFYRNLRPIYIEYFSLYSYLASIVDIVFISKKIIGYRIIKDRSWIKRLMLKLIICPHTIHRIHILEKITIRKNLIFFEVVSNFSICICIKIYEMLIHNYFMNRTFEFPFYYCRTNILIRFKFYNISF